MKRYQLKAYDKNWDAPGPDLLRTNDNAIKHMRSVMDPGNGWYTRTESADERRNWLGPMSREIALQRFDTWSPNDDGRRLWFGQSHGKGRAERIEARFTVRIAVIPDRYVENCSYDVDTIYSLLEYKFPHRRLGGGFVCRQVSGSSTWSQHAYGKALDHTDADPDSYPLERTPQEFDWSLRMAKEGYTEFPVHHIIGTRDRQNEVQALKAEGWVVRSYSGTGSHTWHCHYSTGPADSFGWPACA